MATDNNMQNQLTKTRTSRPLKRRVRQSLMSGWKRWKLQHNRLFDGEIISTEADLEDALWRAFSAGWQRHVPNH
jgi:hypothetical protein